MSNNLIIGLGGTGAKIVESFIHVCAAGLGPETCSVAFVDQDQANGNTARSLRALRLYMEARSKLRDANTASSLRDGTGFLRTHLTPHQSFNKDEKLRTDETALQAAHWTPHGQGRTLADIIQYTSLQDEDRHLADLFFANSDEELGMNLDAGYRGRPHLGSAALLAEMSKGNVGWKSALDELVDRGNNAPVRILLCGSAFGGTGAATLPTLAREIRARADRVPNVAVSAVMLLPYFDFSSPTDAQDGNVAQSPYLRQQTRAALDYYQRLFDAEGLFKRVYMLGWDPLFPLGYHEKGQQNQINPPLVPELFAALGAADAFADDVTNPRANSVVAMGRGAADHVAWTDVPREVDGMDVQGGYGRLLRFAAMWQFDSRPGITREKDRKFGLGAEAWYKQHFGRRFHKDERAYESLGKVDAFVEAFLEYAALMAARSQPSGGRNHFRLWNHFPIGKVDMHGDPRKGVALGGLLRDRPKELSGLVCRLTDQTEPSSYQEVFEALTNYETKTEDGRSNKGVVPFVDALWDVCSIYASESSRTGDDA